MSRRSRSSSSAAFEPVSGIVSSAEQGLGRIADRARRLQALQRALWPSIPEELRPHCQLANYRESTLIFTADSPVWAARLRQASAEILHTAQSNFKIPARRLDVKIVPKNETQAPPCAPRSLPPKVGALLSKAASACSDKELSEALERFASRKSNGKSKD